MPICQREGCEEIINRPNAKRVPIYCSVKCKNKVTITRFAARHPERYAARHPPHKIPPLPVKVICAYEGCGAEFLTNPNQVPIRKYCTNTCQERFSTHKKYGRLFGAPRRPRKRTKPKLSGKDYHLLRRYSMTVADKEAMFDAQGSCCANKGCLSIYSGTGANAAFHVDHDHKTGKIRAILCSFCNRALGLVDDRVHKLRGLITYLEENVSNREIKFCRKSKSLRARLLAEQGGTCANPDCRDGAAKQYHLDHDHDSGFVRGMLCRGCNSALGMLKESYERIYGLIDYLELHAEPEVLPVYPALAAGSV